MASTTPQTPSRNEARIVSLAALIERFERAAEFPSYRLMSQDIEIVVASLKAVDAALRAERLAVVEQIRGKAEAFWSDESVKNDYAFHPSLLWRWLDEVAGLTGDR